MSASVNKDGLSAQLAQASHLYIVEKKSIPDIAEILEWPRSRVRSRLLESGVLLRSRTEGIRSSVHKLGKHLVGKKRIFDIQWCTNISESKRRYADLTALGISKKTNGCVEYTRGKNKGRSVHVVMMEERMGRPLLVDEVVHHIDGNKHNNDIHNLSLMTRAAHARLHRREEQLIRSNHGIR